VEAAEGRPVHNNDWKGANGMALNTRKPCFIYLIPFHYSAPAITMSLSSPIEVPPSSCGVQYVYILHFINYFDAI
jgi:hypothetical protein